MVSPLIDERSITNSPSELIYPPHVTQDWAERFNKWEACYDVLADVPFDIPTHYWSSNDELVADYDSEEYDGSRPEIVDVDGIVKWLDAERPIFRVTPPDNMSSGSLPSMMFVGKRMTRQSSPTLAGRPNMPPSHWNVPRTSATPPSPATHFHSFALPSIAPLGGPPATSLTDRRASPAYNITDGVDQAPTYGVFNSAAQGRSQVQLPDDPQASESTDTTPFTPIFMHYVPPNGKEGPSSSFTALPSASSSAAQDVPAPEHSATTQQTMTYPPYVMVSGPSGKHERLQLPDVGVTPLGGIGNFLPGDMPAARAQGVIGPPPTIKRKKEDVDSQANDGAHPRKKTNNNAKGGKSRSLRREATERAALHSAQHTSLESTPQSNILASRLPVFTPPVPQATQGWFLPSQPGYYH